MSETEVQRMLDEDGIRGTLAQYFIGVSGRDWAMILDCFVSGATVDYGFDTDRTIEAQLELVKIGMSRFDVSTVMGSNCLIRAMDGSQASSVTLALSAHQSPRETGERTRISTVQYEDHWLKGSDGRWRIARRRLDTLWRAWLDPRFDDRAGDHRFAHEWRQQSRP